MAASDNSHLWAYRGIFLLIGITVPLFRILPLHTGETGLPGPDIVLIVALAWVFRQPGAAPVGLIALVIFLADVLLQRPLGLCTLLAVIATEALRTRRPFIAETPFLFEWMVIAGTVLAMVAGQNIILWVLGAPQPSLGLKLVEGLATIAIYPFVVAVSKFLLGMDKLPAMDLESAKP